MLIKIIYDKIIYFLPSKLSNGSVAILTYWLLGLGILLLCLMASVPVNFWAQFIIGWSLYLAIYILSIIRPGRGVFRLFLLFLAAFLLLRYFFWRTFFTLSFVDPFSFIASLTLYIAEVYAMIIFFLGIFVSLHPIKRKPVPLPQESIKHPTVDILIPTYNEPSELLAQTLACAVNIDYPKERFKVYLLDDGGTDARCEHVNPEIAAAARQRRQELSMLAESFGAYYIARKKNDHAKAGNINYALNHIQGELILILDADHAPTRDILQKTVGFFLSDEKLFLVQTPHFFINPDPLEKNLKIFGKLPSENEMFYFNIQHGLDFWNASFFCGSAAILRRKYLLEVGGIAGSTITEDAETALGLHAHGYHSIYLGHPMISGLQPQTFSDFINQRIRWAQGMTQILIMKNPLVQKGLKFYQKLCYLNSSFFWLFAFSRLVFLLAPTCYLFFGLYIYNAYIRDIMAYTIPYLFSSVLISNYLYGKNRRPFISELYELMQSFFLLPALWQVVRAPRAPQFKVTPKLADLKKDFISELAAPFYVIYFILIAALAAAIYRYMQFPTEKWTIIVTALWTIINILLLNGSIGALYERRQLRAQPRIPCNITGLLLVNNQKIPCRISDISTQGCMVKIYYKDYANIKTQTAASLIIHDATLNKLTSFHVAIRYHNLFPEKDTIGIGLLFQLTNQEEIVQATLLALSDSNRWLNIVKEREFPSELLKSLIFIVSIGTKGMLEHYIKIFFNARQIIMQFYCSLSNKKRGILNMKRSGDIND